SKVKESDQSVKKMLDSMTDVIKSKEKSFRSSGDAIVSNLQYGIQQRKSDVEKLSENIVTVWMAVPVKNKYNDFYDVGVYMVTGFSKGISDNLSLAENAAKDMANAAKTSAQKALDEHSPSKVGYQIGDYFGEGFVNALNDYQSISYMAGGKIAGSAKDGLNDAIKGVAESIDDNPELTPTIRPVIDLSDVQRGADTVSSLFGTEHSLGLAYQSESLFNSGVSIARDIKVNNDNVVSEIRNLRNDVNALNTAISEMRVVMDTGALVGSIALPVNRALGRQSKWEQRGH
ncbi:MAG: hypothetical protein II388_05545, partial [Clostridia bacterium]|nr:hypothetical protein [Clostridia bacterium]